jgi:hypothetical protein
MPKTVRIKSYSVLRVVREKSGVTRKVKVGSIEEVEGGNWLFQPNDIANIISDVKRRRARVAYAHPEAAIPAWLHDEIVVVARGQIWLRPDIDVIVIKGKAEEKVA